MATKTLENMIFQNSENADKFVESMANTIKPVANKMGEIKDSITNYIEDQRFKYGLKEKMREASGGYLDGLNGYVDFAMNQWQNGKSIYNEADMDAYIAAQHAGTVTQYSAMDGDPRFEGHSDGQSSEETARQSEDPGRKGRQPYSPNNPPPGMPSDAVEAWRRAREQAGQDGNQAEGNQGIPSVGSSATVSNMANDFSANGPWQSMPEPPVLSPTTNIWQQRLQGYAQEMAQPYMQRMETYGMTTPEIAKNGKESSAKYNAHDFDFLQQEGAGQSLELQ